MPSTASDSPQDPSVIQSKFGNAEDSFPEGCARHWLLLLIYIKSAVNKIIGHNGTGTEYTKSYGKMRGDNPGDKR